VDLPLAVSFRRQDLFPNAHPLYAGDLGLANPPSQMALFRMRTCCWCWAHAQRHHHTGYTFPAWCGRRCALRMSCDPAVIGLHFATDLAIACDPADCSPP